VVAIATTPFLMVLARRTGVVDKPGPLKPQSAAVPYLGGVAVMLALIVGVAVGRPVLAVPLAMAVALGVGDDVADLPPWIRLAGQAAVGAVIGAVVPSRFGAPAAIAIAIVVTVTLVNGVNFLDGIDALVCAVVGAGAAAFALLYGGTGRDLAVGVACALLGFACYNRPPARIYLGDAGSYLLGAALAILLLCASTRGVRSATGVVSLLLVAIPVAELVFAVVRRARGRQALVSGDRGHTYDRMVARGTRVGVVDLAFLAAQLVLGGIALTVSDSHSVTLAISVTAATSVVILVAGAAGGVLAPEAETKA